MRYGTGVALVATAGLLWSLQGLMIRQIGEAEPWAILFWRSVGMVPVLAAFLAWRAGGWPFGGLRRAGLAGVLGGLGLTAAFGGSVLAMESTTIANAVFLFSAAPLLTALLAWGVLGERVAAATWAAIALALAGILVMVGGGLEAGAMTGNVAGLASALGFALFTVTLRWRHVEDSMPFVLMGALFASAAGALAAAAAGQPLIVPVPDALWGMGMGAATLSGGLVLYTLGSRVVRAADLTLLASLEVLLAPFWVWLALGETAGAGTLLGGAMLLAAVILNGLAGVRRLARAGGPAGAAAPAPAPLRRGAA